MPASAGALAYSEPANAVASMADLASEDVGRPGVDGLLVVSGYDRSAARANACPGALTVSALSPKRSSKMPRFSRTSWASTRSAWTVFGSSAAPVRVLQPSAPRPKETASR